VDEFTAERIKGMIESLKAKRLAYSSQQHGVGEGGDLPAVTAAIMLKEDLSLSSTYSSRLAQLFGLVPLVNQSGQGISMSPKIRPTHPPSEEGCGGAGVAESQQSPTMCEETLTSSSMLAVGQEGIQVAEMADDSIAVMPLSGDFWNSKSQIGSGSGPCAASWLEGANLNAIHFTRRGGFSLVGVTHDPHVREMKKATEAAGGVVKVLSKQTMRLMVQNSGLVQCAGGDAPGPGDVGSRGDPDGIAAGVGDATERQVGRVVKAVKYIWVLPLSKHVVIFLRNPGSFQWHLQMKGMLEEANTKLGQEQTMVAAVVLYILQHYDTAI